MHPKEFIINYDSVKRNISKIANNIKFRDHIYPFTGTDYIWDQGL